MSNVPDDFQDETAYILTESHLLDLAHHAVQLFLANRTEHELEDDDNWNDVEMGLFAELEKSDIERVTVAAPPQSKRTNRWPPPAHRPL